MRSDRPVATKFHLWTVVYLCESQLMRFSSNLLLHDHPPKCIPDSVRLVKDLVCGSREIRGGTFHLRESMQVRPKWRATYDPDFRCCVCHVLQKEAKFTETKRQ